MCVSNGGAAAGSENFKPFGCTSTTDGRKISPPGSMYAGCWCSTDIAVFLLPAVYLQFDRKNEVVLCRLEWIDFHKVCKK